MREACQRVLADQLGGALQYGPTEGYLPLREWLAAEHGVGPDQVLITTGSQQALDLVAKVFVDPGAPVLVETPTYLGALQAFATFEARFVSLDSDDEGIRPEALTPQVALGARFVYVLPNFQNPTGRRMSTERRDRLVRWAASTGVPIVEDDPYGELSYAGSSMPSLRSKHPEGVIYLGSLSKILAPGLRLGYVIAPPHVLQKMVQAKQAADLHTSTFTQQLAYEVVRTGLLSRHVPVIRQLYASQCEAMLAALTAAMPPGVSWNRPRGGMFLWLRLPPHISSTEALGLAIQKNVAFVPGVPFYADAPEPNTLRLAFVTVPADRIAQGISTLGQVFRQMIQSQRGTAPTPAAW